jgi:hypothetical protein
MLMITGAALAASGLVTLVPRVVAAATRVVAVAGVVAVVAGVARTVVIPVIPVVAKVITGVVLVTVMVLVAGVAFVASGAGVVVGRTVVPGVAAVARMAPVTRVTAARVAVVIGMSGDHVPRAGVVVVFTVGVVAVTGDDHGSVVAGVVGRVGQPVLVGVVDGGSRVRRVVLVTVVATGRRVVAVLVAGVCMDNALAVLDGRQWCLDHGGRIVKLPGAERRCRSQRHRGAGDLHGQGLENEHAAVPFRHDGTQRVPEGVSG